jgi:hypothetical protein
MGGKRLRYRVAQWIWSCGVSDLLTCSCGRDRREFALVAQYLGIGQSIWSLGYSATDFEAVVKPRQVSITTLMMRVSAYQWGNTI